MLSRFLGTGAGHIALGLRSEPEIPVADTTPDCPPIPNDAAAVGPDHEVTLDDEYDSGDGVLSGSDSDSDKEPEEPEAVFDNAKGQDDGWEDDDEDGFENDGLLPDYDYSN